MSKYIDINNMSAKDKESLRFFSTQISAVSKNFGNDLSDFISNYLIKGTAIDLITKKEIKLPGFPKKVQNPATNLNNIKDYFNELLEIYPFEKKVQDTIKNVGNSFKVKFVLKVLDSNFSPDSEIKGMDKQMKSVKKSTYENYIAFARANAVHESREKPKWYQFTKRYSLWKEKKQLEKFERLLIAKGVKTSDIVNAKRFSPTREKVFEVKPNIHDQLRAIDNELRESQLQISEYDQKQKASSKRGKEFLKHAMKAYELINDFKNKSPASNNEYDKSGFATLKYFKDNFDEMVNDRIEFDTTTLEELKEEIHAKDLASKMNEQYKEIEKVHVEFEKEVFSESEVEFDLEKPLDNMLEKENDLENAL